MKFLIDECLTVELVGEAGEGGYEAYHLVRIGKAGWPDRTIALYAVENDLVLVTNNAADFRRLYRAQPIHPGLIIVLPNVDRLVQRVLFRQTLVELKTVGVMVNKVLEVDFNGDELTFNVYDLPARSE